MFTGPNMNTIMISETEILIDENTYTGIENIIKPT